MLLAIGVFTKHGSMIGGLVSVLPFVAAERVPRELCDVQEQRDVLVQADISARLAGPDQELASL